MPSQQPPHLLSTPKLGLERERDMMGSSGVQDWNLPSPSSNSLSNITCTSPGAAASPSGTSSSIMCPASTALNASASRNRPGSVNGGVASSSIGSAHTHLPPSLNNTYTATESGHSSEPPSNRATSASRSTMPRTNESGESRIATNTVSNMEKRLGMEGSTTVSTFASTSMSDDTSLSPSDYKAISARNSLDRSNNLTPLPRRRHRTQSSQGRTRLQSPSVQLALADPTLSKSLSASPSSRPTLEQDQQAHAKQNFEKNVQRYYYQLTVGCQLNNCTNKLCRSSKSSPRMTKDAAAILSIQLATRPRLFFCKNCPLDSSIHVPDSPLPASAPCNNLPNRQRMQDLPPKLKTPKLTTAASSPRPSLGPGGSVEDLTHPRDHTLYQPSEYSKSVPSFKVPNILSPVTTSHSSAVFHRKSESTTATHSTTETSTATERSGTPLFRTLLSVSPFSSMFSTRSHSTKKQDECKRRGLSPSQRNKKFSSAGSTDGSIRVSGRDADLYSAETRNPTGTLQAPHRRRSFSPTRSVSPPSSPISTTTTATEGNDTFRVHPFLRKDGPSFTRRDQHSPGKHFVDYAEEAIGLGFTSKLLQSQKVLDLSRYYHASSMSEAKISRSRGRRKQRRRSRGNNDDQASESSFESSRGPDSDSLDSCSSADDEQTKIPDQPWREPLLSDPHLETQPGQELHPIPTTSAIQPISSSPLPPFEHDFGQKHLCSGNRSGHQIDSTTVVNPMVEAAPGQRSWLIEESAASSFSSSSSRRSSVSDGGDLEVALPYLNLALLRQAIATYNTSKPEQEMLKSLPLLDFKDFRPISTDTEVRSFESGDDQEDTVLTRHEAEVGRRRLGLKYESDPNDGFRTPPSFDNKESIADPLVIEQAGDMPRDHRHKSSDADSNGLMSEFGITCPQDNVSSESEADDFFESSQFSPSVHSMASSSTYSAGGDSTFLVDSLRSVFSSALALGSSFLMKDREERSESDEDKDTAASLGGVNVGGIDLEALRECYEMMIELKPRTIFAIRVTNSIEILLAKLELEQELAMGQKQWTEEEMRAILILLMNPFLFEQPYQESLLRRILLIFISFQDTTTLIEWLSCMDEEGMAQLVTLFKMYLSAHFTPRPAGPKHPAICAVKALSILYEANDIGTKREQEKQRRSAIQGAKDGKAMSGLSEATSTISYKYFYSGVMEALKFKDEYQIWREGWGKSEEEKTFSYFDYPFLLSPTSKSHIMNLDALTQMSAHYEDACVRHALADHAQRLLPETMTASAREFQKGIRAGSSPYLVLELRRAHLVEEAFEQITKKHADLKKPLKVAFVDVGEEGMDQGGVTKEFFQIMVEKVFDSQFGLFKELEEGRCWWFEGVLDGSSHVELSKKEARIRLIEYELVGILVGLALYNGVILGVRFPSVVYRKLLGWEVGLDTFIESFPALGHGLEQMLTWSDGDVYDVFMREFEISYEHLGQVTTIPLVPDGQDIAVTNENREAYVQAYMDHYVHEHIQQEFAAFQRGFEKICGGEALKLLRPEELELLLCGNSDLDMHDLEASCLYDDGYSPSHTLIKEFWEIVHEDMTPEQHKQLLVFVTGSDRVPIRGLKDLMFVIQRNGPDSDRLPTALTCFSRLLLPEYADKQKMKERLVTAIENSTGFGLVPLNLGPSLSSDGFHRQAFQFRQLEDLLRDLRLHSSKGLGAHVILDIQLLQDLKNAEKKTETQEDRTRARSNEVDQFDAEFKRLARSLLTKKMRKERQKNCALGIVDKYRTSEICIYCLQDVRLGRSRRMIKSKAKMVRVHGSFECINRECPLFKEGYTVKAQDPHVTAPIAFAGGCALLFHVPTENNDENASPSN
ncbi:hypothetical protein BGZ50_009103 [Haplosporangium sp. Z 11]|nr:hypothetical protein BGZ50_009103 [Haplosporangium sp. Z 11]